MILFENIRVFLEVCQEKSDLRNEIIDDFLYFMDFFKLLNRNLFVEIDEKQIFSKI